MITNPAPTEMNTDLSDARSDLEIDEKLGCFIMVCTLVATDFTLSKLKDRSVWFSTMVDGAPLVIVDNGKPLKIRVRKSKVDESDIQEAARISHGLEKMEQDKYAVLERNGPISIIRRKQ